MKLYTLEYDCNRPTVQQVNIPTNTDYKIGVKVRRNGEIQNLSPESVKMFTGESTEIEPTEFDFVAKDVSSGGFLVSYNETSQTDISSLYSKSVKCTDIYIESSTDDGTTWTRTVPTGTQWMRINDRSAGTNNYVAQKELSDPDSKFELTDSSGIYGYAKEIELPSVVRFSGNFNTDFWGNTTFPCKMRLVIKYGGYTKYEYISPDDEKTNGYVTFTLSSDDNVSYTQETLSVDTNISPLGTSQVAEVDNSAGSAAVKLSCDIPVDESMVGWTLVPAPDYFKVMRGIKLTKPVKISDLTSTLYDGWNFNQPPAQFAEEANGRRWYLINPEASGTGRYLGYADPGETNFTPADSMELTPGTKWHVVTNANVNAGTVGALGFIVNLRKDGFTASFTLNTNIFKSQQGDINITAPDASIVVVEGTYADGTEFSFNFVTK